MCLPFTAIRSHNAALALPQVSPRQELILLKHWILALASCTASMAALAQIPLLQERNIAHRIHPGDTLEALAQRYLGDATLWPALQSHNQVASPYRLQPGSVLEIPLRLMRSASASVNYVQGSAHIHRNGTAAALQPGTAVHEGDRLQLDPEAFVSVRLADGSMVKVQANSQVELRQLRRRGRAGSLQSVLDVQQGGVEVQVPGKPDAQRRLDVLTPVAATSVRGTVFDVHVASDGRATTAVLRGRVSVQATSQAQKVQPLIQMQAPTELGANTGIAIAANGQASAVVPLLPAPAAMALSQLNEDAQWLNLPMPTWQQAKGWRVSVSSDAQGQQILRNGQFDSAMARFSAVPDGDYFLHVRAIDAHGISGLPATAPLRVKAHPVPPLVQSLPAGGVLALGEAQLQCTPVDGVRQYRHQVVALDAQAAGTAQAALNAAAFAQPLLTHSSDDVCTLDMRHLPAGDYAWRAASVRIVNGHLDHGPYAAPHLFRIAPRPTTPSLQAMQEQTHAGVATIHWPADPGQRFRLQAFAHPDSSETPALDITLDSPQWAATGLPAGTWHIRIQVQDPSGLHSAFSPLRRVQVRALVQDGFGQPVSTGTGLGLEHP